MMPIRYFLAQDSSAHWYLVEADCREAWEAWAKLDDDDPESWDAPYFATRISGSPSNVTFESPEDPF